MFDYEWLIWSFNYPTEGRMIPKFVDSYKKLAEVSDSIRMRFCPHCQKSSSLVKHGYIWGVDYSSKQPDSKIIRARRFFCSNKGTRCGCGKTVTVYHFHSIPKTSILAPLLWQWLQIVLDGFSIHSAWYYSGIKFSLSTAYRLWHKAKTHISYWKSQLVRLTDWSTISGTSVLGQVLNHFKSAFEAEPFASLQLRFQRWRRRDPLLHLENHTNLVLPLQSRWNHYHDTKKEIWYRQNPKDLSRRTTRSSG